MTSKNYSFNKPFQATDKSNNLNLEVTQSKLQNTINNTRITMNNEGIKTLSNAAMQVKNFMLDFLVNADPEDKKAYAIDDQLKRMKENKQEALKGTLFEPGHVELDDLWVRSNSKKSKKKQTIINDSSTKAYLDRLNQVEDQPKTNSHFGKPQRKESFQKESPMLFSKVLLKKDNDSNSNKSNALLCQLAGVVKNSNKTSDNNLLSTILQPKRAKSRKFIYPMNKQSCKLVRNQFDEDLNLNENHKNDIRRVQTKTREFKDLASELKESIILAPKSALKANEKPNINESKRYKSLHDNEEEVTDDEEQMLRQHNLELKELRYRCLVSNTKLVYDSLSDAESDEEALGEFYIHPFSINKISFDCLIIVLTIYSFILTPYSFAFDFNKVSQVDKWNSIMEYIIDIFFSLDIILGFFTAYGDYEEQLITKFQSIVWNYTINWFKWDLLCGIPFNTIIILFSNNESEIILTYISDLQILYNFLRLLRLLKLFKVFYLNSAAMLLYKTLMRFDKITRWIRFILSLCVFFLLVHLLSCIFIFLGQMEYPNWLSAQNININKRAEVYVTSFYYICTTIFTIGYGDVLSVSTYERFFNLFLLIVGIMIYSWAVTSLSNYVQTVDYQTLAYQKKVAILEQIRVTHDKLPPLLYDKIARFLKFKLHDEKKDKNDIIDNLPITLRNTLIIEMYKPVINNFLFFKNFDNTEFILQVILKFKTIQASKNDKLVNDGDYIEDMIFVKQGILVVEIPMPMVLKDDALINIQRKATSIKFSKSLTMVRPPKKEPDKIELHEYDRDDIDKKNSLGTSSSENSRFAPRRLQTQYIKIIEIRRNEHFGDILMFLNRRSPLTVKVKSKVAELFLLNKTDAVQTSMKYRRIWRKIIKKSLFNYEQIERLMNKTLKFFYIHNEGESPKKQRKHYYHKDITKKNTLINSQALLSTLQNDEMCELKSIPTTEEEEEDEETNEEEEEEEEDDEQNNEQNIIEEVDGEDEESKHQRNVFGRTIIPEEDNENGSDDSPVDEKSKSLSKSLTKSLSKSRSGSFGSSYDSDSKSKSKSLISGIPGNMDENTVHFDNNSNRKKYLHSLIDSSSRDGKDKRSNFSQLNTLPFSQEEVNRENYPDENSIDLKCNSMIPSIMPKEASEGSGTGSNGNDNYVHFYNGTSDRKHDYNKSSSGRLPNEFNICHYYPSNQQFTDVKVVHSIEITLEKASQEKSSEEKTSEQKKTFDQSLTKLKTLQGSRQFLKSKSVCVIQNPQFNSNELKESDNLSLLEEEANKNGNNQSQQLNSKKNKLKKTLTMNNSPVINSSLGNMMNSNPIQTQNSAKIKKNPTHNSSSMYDLVADNIARHSDMLNNPKRFYSKMFKNVQSKEGIKDENKVISKKLVDIVKLIEEHNPKKGRVKDHLNGN